MLLSFVLPEMLLAVALLFVITTVRSPLELGTTAQVIGLVTFQLSYPVVHRAGPAAHHRQAVRGGRNGPRRVAARRAPAGLLPMLMPAIFASAVLVFADVIDDFVHRALPVR